jgi:carbamoyl-phosphate synthase large subunit
MNILLTAVGRRSYLVRYFQKALQNKGLVVATNSQPDTPGMYVADVAQVVPPSHDPAYVDAIIDICRRHCIRLLCSCHDLDVLALALAADRLEREGVIAILPNADWARTCLDKYECGKRLKAAGFSVPWASISLGEAKSALTQGLIRLPLLIKARLGFGSLGLNKCCSAEELAYLIQHTATDIATTPLGHFLAVPPGSSALIQEYLRGPEYCISLVNNLNGHYAAHFISEIHAMRAGESDRATTVSPATLGDLPQRLSELTQHVGIWGIDVMMDNGDPKIIDINPRFTGDYPFQHIAGADIPAALVAWSQGLVPQNAWLKPDVGISGFKDLTPTRITHSTRHS